jgi:hypothetical protein
VVVELVDGPLRVYVELLDFLALDVLVTRRTQDVREPRALRAARDQLPGQREVVEQVGQRPG